MMRVLQVAVRRPAFWGLVACFGLIWLNHGILITYVLELFTERGAGAGMIELASASVSGCGAVSCASTIGSATGSGVSAAATAISGAAAGASSGFAGAAVGDD